VPWTIVQRPALVGLFFKVLRERDPPDQSFIVA